MRLGLAFGLSGSVAFARGIIVRVGDEANPSHGENARWWLAALPALAVEYTGRVVGISDGDTLTRLTPEKQPIRVRLADIDTLESRQPYGERAKQALSDLAFGKAAREFEPDADRDGRERASACC